MNQNASSVRRRHLGVTGAVIAICGTALAIYTYISYASLPARVATHFGINGHADQWASRGAGVASMLAFAIGIPLTMWIVDLLARWWQGSSARLFAGIVTGLSIGLSVTGWIWLRDQISSPLPIWAWILAFAGVVAGAATVAALTPRMAPAETTAATPMPLPAQTRAAWVGTARNSRSVDLAIAGLMIAAAVIAIVSGARAIWIVLALVLLLVVALSSFTVRIGADGVAWHGAFGLPRGTIPLDEVTQVGTVDVRSGDFGGYGIRQSLGKLGLITRNGTALRIDHDGRTFIATVDDAATAAALLQSLIDRRHKPAR